jgi:predicted kinase
MVSEAKPFTVFLLSPANLGGERAALVFNPDAGFPLARQLRAPGGAELGELFSFVSGLYFRGKLTYATVFGRPPPELSGALVISPGEGLRFPHERLTLDRLRAWATVEIDAGNKQFTTPLVKHAEALERAYGAQTRFVLLGSVASDKYVKPLTRVFGDHLLFPPAFVGRGDMSRGAMLLRAARAAEELEYLPIEGALRHGPRAPSINARRRGPTAAATVPVAATAMVELAVLVGLPAAGKSTFFEQRLAATHLWVSKDHFRNNRRPAYRQEELIAAALAADRSLAIDNTNASVEERAAIIRQARAHGRPVRVVGYFFECTPRECLARNAARAGAARIPNVGIFATAKRLVRPTRAEGFDDLFVVEARPGPSFDIKVAG